jgi:hypothetical protein
MDLFPVVFSVSDFTETYTPDPVQTPVSPASHERICDVGFRCEFCLRMYRVSFTGGEWHFPVEQVFVTKTGLEASRWGGGDPVWRCQICAANGRLVTRSGMITVPPKVPEATASDVKNRIGNTVFSKVQSIKW